MQKKLDKKLGLTNQVKKLIGKSRRINFQKKVCQIWVEKEWKRWVEQLGENV